MALTVAECVWAFGTEFNNVPEEDIEKLAEMLKPLVSKKKFGDLYEQALALLICHKLKLQGRGENAASGIGGAGSISSGFNISSISDGGTSISFNSSMGQGNLAADAEFAMTSYGVQFLQLRRYCIVPITIAGGLCD